ncbi:MAG: universal stress protein [Steroidobacteraceae bacterium]
MGNETPAKAYERILAIVDLTADSESVLARAAEVTRSRAGLLSVLHVVEYMPIEPLSDSLVPVVQIDEKLLERARVQLQELAARHGVAAAQCQVSSGNIKTEVLRVARAWSPDLIVLGSRARHGLSILINLTEDTVLHAAPCDVLAVRVR